MSLSSLSEAESISDCNLAVSDFEELAKIGEGFFGEIFIVQLHGDKMVKKQIKPGHNTDEFGRELSIMRTLSHKHVVSLIFEFDTRSDCAIFELCAGGNLNDFIEKNDRLDLDTTKRFAQEITDGLAYVHDNNVLHRDLKSENIFLSGRSVKIGDFGSAVRVQANKKLLALEGSPINCSPEMIQQTGYSFPRDWWSVGIIVYHMLVGNVPFDGEDQMAIFMQILLEKPVFPAFVDDQSKKFIRGLLRKNPAKRFTADDVYAHEWLDTQLTELDDLLEEEMAKFTIGSVDDDIECDI